MAGLAFHRGDSSIIAGMPEPESYSLDIQGDEFAILEWPGSGDPILLLHATGFHSYCWNQVVKHLPGRHVYAVDLRFHGGSTNTGEVDWALMAEDIEQLIDRLELDNVIGVGHSIGGHLIACAAAAKPARFRHAVLIDPVIMPPEEYDQRGDALKELAPKDHPVSRRKNNWQDAEEMFNRFKDKFPFSSWQTEVLRDYCDYALTPHSEEDYLELACDPLNEAAIYLSSLGNRAVLTALPLVTTPVTLLRARDSGGGGGDLSSSPTWPGLAQALPNCSEHYLPEMNHFIPMQDPAMVAGHILAACETHSD